MTADNRLPANWHPVKPYSGTDKTLKALDQLRCNINAGTANLFDDVDPDDLMAFQISPANRRWQKDTLNVDRQLTYLGICSAVQAVNLLFATKEPRFGAALSVWLEEQSVECKEVADSNPQLYTCTRDSVRSTRTASTARIVIDCWVQSFGKHWRPSARPVGTPHPRTISNWYVC